MRGGYIDSTGAINRVIEEPKKIQRGAQYVTIARQKGEAVSVFALLSWKIDEIVRPPAAAST